MAKGMPACLLLSLLLFLLLLLLLLLLFAVVVAVVVSLTLTHRQHVVRAHETGPTRSGVG